MAVGGGIDVNLGRHVAIRAAQFDCITQDALLGWS